MKWLRAPCTWFILAVLLLAAGGARLLDTRACKERYDDDWHRYGQMNTWQAAFDALSASCGVGLLTCDIDEDYTARGRWTLTGLGVAGALLFLAGALQAARRLRSACGETAPLPATWSVLSLFVVLLAISVPVVGGLETLAASHTDWAGATWRALAAAASLGWLPGHPSPSTAWIYVPVALLGGLGWMIWLLPATIWRARYLYVPRALTLVGGYFAFLLLAAALIFALEAPRGHRRTTIEGTSLTGRPPATRFSRSLVQTVCASTAGIPTEELGDRSITDATKMTLAAVMLAGPLGGSAGGGVKWTLLLWGLSGAAAALAPRGRSTHSAGVRCLLAGTGCLLLLVILATVTALGLLIIETHTASPYHSPPTFADAFLDAASAVAGGNLSSGLFHTVTHRNLSSGIRQGVDLYQYGMVWLIAAMLVGRALPLLVLCWAARARLADTPRCAPPLI